MVNTRIRLIIFSAAVYIPTNGVEGSPFLYILADTWYLLVFLRVAVWTGVRWLLLVVLTCPSLMLSDAEHLYVSVGRLDIFFGKMSIQVLRLFLNWSIQWWVFFFPLSWVVWVPYVFWILTPYQVYEIRNIAPILLKSIYKEMPCRLFWKHRVQKSQVEDLEIFK